MVPATHAPLDAVIIMLQRPQAAPLRPGHGCGSECGVLVAIVSTYPLAAGTPRPKVVLISPPLIVEPGSSGGLFSIHRSRAESHKLARPLSPSRQRGRVRVLRRRPASPAPAQLTAFTSTLPIARAIGTALAPLVRTILEHPASRPSRSAPRSPARAVWPSPRLDTPTPRRRSRGGTEGRPDRRRRRSPSFPVTCSTAPVRTACSKKVHWRTSAPVEVVIERPGHRSPTLAAPE